MTRIFEALKKSRVLRPPVAAPPAAIQPVRPHPAGTARDPDTVVEAAKPLKSCG